MNDEKPSGVKKANGRPFDGGLGPTAKAAGGVLLGQPQLSAEQLHGDNDGPSWKAPAEKRGISNAALITIIVALASVALILLRVTGVI
jgi:hypothetical protein